MKKIILLAAAIGLTATLSGKADDAAKDIWTAHCAICHGADGKGQTKMGTRLGIRDFTDAKVQASFTDADATKALRSGLTSDDGKTLMKPMDALTDDQIKAMVAYVRGLKG